MKIPGSWSTGALGLTLAIFVAIPMGGTAQARDGGSWVLPRTADGHPDLQGNWTNATITPIQRPPDVGPTLTPDQVAAIEGQRQGFIDELAAPSDPDREALPVGRGPPGAPR